MPDLRNTLYWAPRYEITQDNGGSFTFYTSDLTGEFMVVGAGHKFRPGRYCQELVNLQ
jgi:hypothetical protein